MQDSDAPTAPSARLIAHRQLLARGFALAELGAPEGVWRACDVEGAALWPHMRAGVVHSRLGALSGGVDASGNERGDRSVGSSLTSAGPYTCSLTSLGPYTCSPLTSPGR